jgi:hypothetical protein
MGGQAIGARLLSTAHPYRLEAVLDTYSASMFGRANKTDPTFIAETAGSPATRRQKLYWRASRPPHVVMASGEVWPVVGRYSLKRG